ncbi:MAG: helix-turn-helix domain-containing protein [Deltaproteobacteria bacterium]|jgi:predicted transcriptional regulator|nr:helix-turn-helix domain-containing protein [Deltaproteobacteria bacterium]
MKINGPAFQKYREHQLLSVSELAKKSEVSPSVVNNIEQGKPSRLESIRRVIAGLGLTVEEARSQKFIEG